MTVQDKGAGARLGRRDVLKGAAAMGGALLLPATVRAAEPGPRRGGTLRVTLTQNPGSLDPMTGRNLTDCNVLYTVFDSLIDFEPTTLALRPGLAKAWRFTDPTTLVLDLVDGVEFHDGTPFNAEAAKFNLDRYRTDPRSNVKPDLASVKAVEITGKSQVTLHLHSANSGLPAILTNRAGIMVSPAAIKKHGNVDRNPVGTGPFTFVSWEDNARVRVVRNKNYWKPGLPYLDALDMPVVTEQNTAARTVLSGQSDLALNLGPDQKMIADHAKNVVAIATPSLVFFGSFLNYARPPFDDVRIRQALNYGIDRPELVKVLQRGLAEPSSAILPTAYWACDPSTAHYYNFDPERARKLLADAGHPNGIEIKAWGWPDQTSMRRQELLISQLAKAGIRVKMTPASPPQAMQSMMIEKRGDMLFSPCSAYPDPSQLYEAVFAKDALRNAGKIELPGFRPLMNATVEAQSQDERKEAFAKLQRFVIEQALEQPQYIAYGINVATPKLKNYTLGLLTMPKFTEVWLEA